MKNYFLILSIGLSATFDGVAQSTNASNNQNFCVNGTDCSGYGNSVLNNNTGNDNSAVGYSALYTNGSAGNHNTACGSEALYTTNEFENTAVGYRALYLSTTSGQRNTALGSEALDANTSGSYNTAVGYTAISASTGDGNTAIGAHSDVTSGFNNQTAVGYSASTGGNNEVMLGTPSTNRVEGEVNLSTISDFRFKENISEDVKGLDFILRLRPVSYNLDTRLVDDGRIHTTTRSLAGNKFDHLHDVATARRRTGLLAQEVHLAAIQSGFDFEGISIPQSESQHYGLKYDLFVLPLIKAVQQQQAQIDQLEKSVSERSVAVSSEVNTKLGLMGLLGTKLAVSVEGIVEQGDYEILISELNGRTEISATLISLGPNPEVDIESLQVGLHRACLVHNGTVVSEIVFSKSRN